MTVDEAGGPPADGGETLSREAAVDRVEELLETVEDERMPVPVREVWVYGGVALGLDPVERLNVYLTKDVLMADDQDPDAAERFRESHGIRGVGKSVRADWAEAHPEHLRANDAGHAAPEQCLAAQLLDDEPVHLEVCNSSFEDNVTQRLEGAMAREAYHEILDPRGVCLWVDDGSESGHRSEEAMAKVRDAELPFPKLSDALSMLGVDESEAETAARALTDYRAEQEGATVRGDVV